LQGELWLLQSITKPVTVRETAIIQRNLEVSGFSRVAASTVLARSATVAWPSRHYAGTVACAAGRRGAEATELRPGRGDACKRKLYDAGQGIIMTTQQAQEDEERGMDVARKVYQVVSCLCSLGLSSQSSDFLIH